jgi:chemotaxis protein histidine kinase CheA
MMASEPFPPNSSYSSMADIAEAELQQELRAMFEVDTQQYLQEYFSLIQCLNPSSWAADIQHIYRAIHTIKGGAVTVEADAMLHAGMVLEDLLSDLRYLDQCPDLSDGQLSQMLLEAGELLSSSIEIQGTGAAAIAQVQPTVQRIQTLHELIRQRYLPDWNEMKQVHQEFAEQGFDLVVLELEMALDKLSSQRSIPKAILHTGQQTLDQLVEIGQDLQFAKSWILLVARCQALIDRANSAEWQQCWPQYFPILKDCAKQGGELNATLQAQLKSIDDCANAATSDSDLHAVSSDFENTEVAIPDNLSLDLLPTSEWLSEDDLEGLMNFASDEAALLPLEANHKNADATPTEFSEWLDEFSLEHLTLGSLVPEDLILENTELHHVSLDDSVDAQLASLSIFEEIKTDLLPPDLMEHTSSTEVADILQNELLPDWDIAGIADLDNLSLLSDLENADLLAINEVEVHEVESFNDLAAFSFDLEKLSPQAAPPVPAVAHQTKAVAPEPISEPTPEITPEIKRSVQISIPLERLDQSAQQVVETLLNARSVMNISQKLQTQMAQVTALTQESAQFITRLRQLQDDYALLRNLSDTQDSSQNVTLERYRQGYTTINRLLENILRMSELGQEIETVTQQTTGRLDKLDRSISRLKDGIETSRLIPFRNLSLKARAIVRDLSNRYGKPATLAVEGEQVELDAGILQQLEPALLHLLRNAYDHGLESVDTRLANGKPAQGRIQLSLHRRGNLYRLVLQDDGGGIDPRAIARMAQDKQCTLYQTRTSAELLAVLCQPGFSSRDTVTEVSGRGVGMDVVASQITALNGKLSLETKLGKGTTFIIEVPAPQLLVPCVLVEVGDNAAASGSRTIALPTDEILETILIDPAQLSPLESDNPLLTWKLQTSRGDAFGFDLAQYWQQTTQASEKSLARSLPDTAIAIRTRSTDTLGFEKDLWFIADDLIGQEELLINPLPSPLISPAGLLGVSLQPDGCLISILDPVALTTAINTLPTEKADQRRRAPMPAAAAQSSFMKILLVDDAALMRRRLESSLTTYGFTTFTCADGLEAWNWLQSNECPNLMITDIEMPQMDGFTLIDRCRQAGLKLPILVVSSRLSEEWGKEARRLGADDYLNKGFSTPELMSKVNQLLGMSALSLF